MNEQEQAALKAEQERILKLRRDILEADQARFAVLKARIEQLETHQRNLLDMMPLEELAQLEGQRNRLQQRIERLEAALRFYADGANYWENKHNAMSPVGIDDGDIARKALESEDSE